jgi:arylsulfatase A-like enzyme
LTTSSQPNVIFIVADQMKWNTLQMYSEFGIEAPSLERLASEGVRFENGVTPHPLCVPARVSMMTSRYAHSTGARRNETLMPPGELHAFRIWKDLGYSTGLIGKNHCFVEPSDLETLDVLCELPHLGQKRRGITGPTRGMDWVVDEETLQASSATRTNMPEQSPTISYAISEHDLEGYTTNAITSQSEAFIERAVAGDRFDGSDPDAENVDPFALFVSYPDPHHPLEAHRKYADMIPPESVKFPPQREGEFDGPEVPERNKVLKEILGLQYDSEEDAKAAVAVYLAMTRMVDDAVGRLLDKLDELGQRENTIVVFTADHGDFAGEHGMIGKGGLFYDAMIRVPYIVSWPAGGVPENVVDSSPVNTIDLVPTILQLSGVVDFTESPPLVEGDELAPAGPRVAAQFESDLINPETLRRFQGRPLPTVTSAAPRAACYSEYGTGGPPFTLELLNQIPATNGFSTVIDSLWMREAEGRRKMVRTVDWKYVTDPDEGPINMDPASSTSRKGDELYDLRNDPWELTNIATDPANVGVISTMRALLNEWMMETEDPNPVPLPVVIGRQKRPWFSNGTAPSQS